MIDCSNRQRNSGGVDRSNLACGRYIGSGEYSIYPIELEVIPPSSNWGACDKTRLEWVAVVPIRNACYALQTHNMTDGTGTIRHRYCKDPCHIIVVFVVMIYSDETTYLHEQMNHL